jgi:hypothetical protein
MSIGSSTTGIVTSLPLMSFVSFAANKLADAALLWDAHGAWVAPNCPLDYAFALPLEKDNRKAYLPNTATFLAERYGGQGVGSNGGGVRCGLLNGIQVKGIGRNPLAGRGADFFHSYGGASLNEGMAEAIWGEVLDSALPYGASRVQGLIATGTRVPLLAPKPGQDPTTARALILREALLRPAHYMRSAYFDPVDERLSIISDTDRTRAAVATLASTLRRIYAPDNNSTSDREPALSELLHAMFRRYARQIAAARAKRIMHGSLIDSNLCLDGRWLDFGTASTLPDHGRYFISPGAPDFLNEHLMLRKSIKDFHFYLRKYLPQTQAFALCTENEIWLEFVRALDVRLPLEFCKLTGIPESALTKLDQRNIDEMYVTIQRIIGLKSQNLFSLCEAESSGHFNASDIPSRLGQYHLSNIMQSVSFANSAPALQRCVLPHIADVRLRDEFVRNYVNIRNEYLQTFSESQQGCARAFLSANAFRVNTTLPEFFRPAIYSDIERCLLSGANVRSFVDERIAIGQTVLRDATDDLIDVSHWFASPLTVSATCGIVANGETISVRKAATQQSAHASGEALKKFWAQYDDATTTYGY